MDASNVNQTKQIKSAEQANTTNQSNTALNKFHEALIQSADANKKIKINTYKSPSFYLSPIDNIFEFLGFPLTQKKLIDFIETAYESPLKVSRTSRYEFFNKGVSLKTVSKIVVWFKKLPIPLEQLFK
ncbi:MAG: 5-methylcytosine-specific restriction endonuclease McrBC regulatory subunit McrC [Colwellia sp.]|jgi:5-methylcytosine-specific restriction endonuclease McrBC regulatory subunit McrC